MCLSISISNISTSYLYTSSTYMWLCSCRLETAEVLLLLPVNQAITAVFQVVALLLLIHPFKICHCPETLIW